MDGVVMRIHPRGFAFLRGDKIKDSAVWEGDVFLHASDFLGNPEDLNVGSQVRFDVVRGPKGYRAINASLISS